MVAAVVVAVVVVVVLLLPLNNSSESLLGIVPFGKQSCLLTFTCNLMFWNHQYLIIKSALTIEVCVVKKPSVLKCLLNLYFYIGDSHMTVINLL